MKSMSWASRSQSPARSATQADAPSAWDRFLSAFARDWRANFSAFVEPLEPLRVAVLVIVRSSLSPDPYPGAGRSHTDGGYAQKPGFAKSFDQSKDLASSSSLAISTCSELVTCKAAEDSS